MESHTRLAGFVRFLEDRGLVQFDVMGDGDKRFSTRFRIQKYVFLAQKMGLDTPYNYGIYIRGPYSKLLADSYYHLARNRSEYEHADEQSVGTLDTRRFLSVVKNKNDKWLEIATTLIERKPHCAGREDMVNRVRNVKDEPEPGYISRVFDELKDLRLV